MASWNGTFLWMVAGQVISLFGNAALRLVLPLYLLERTQSPALFGLVSALSFLPMILLAPMGGIAADRLPKARMMAVLDFGTALLCLGLVLLMGTAPLVPLLTAGMMLLYAIQGAYQPAVQAAIPVLVPKERLVKATALVNQVTALSSLLGPALGGMLYGKMGITVVLLLSGGCFLASALLEWMLHIPHSPRNPQGDSPRVGQDIRESLHFLTRTHPELAQLMGVVCAFNLLLSAMLIVGLPVILIQRLGVSDTWYGGAQGAMSLGGLLGGCLAGVLGERARIRSCPRWLLLCGLLASGMALPLVMDAPPMISYGVVVVTSMGLMAAASLFSIVTLAFLQGHTPPELAGKVISCVLALSLCASPLGQVLYGWCFQSFPAWAVVLGAAASSAAVALLSRPVFRRLDP